MMPIMFHIFSCHGGVRISDGVVLDCIIFRGVSNAATNAITVLHPANTDSCTTQIIYPPPGSILTSAIVVIFT